ncbi:hypothetical protein IscW_ISCW016676 [Ixodes scapularis]|uniref:Uncharacterized protein n=1 Tax=Ixodes scapularis TaxID=6945 RepID=B7PBK0_IXOSC|nr:hypothetical protein IscW_ISCW016676 [Ixodes scapularis]|eukprot:XP_002408332.1 hypothetical protein IscW_ISCW016676 [Ixodes scapularis]
MSKLMAVRVVHDSWNAEILGTLYDQIETSVRSLEDLGLEEKTYGVLLLTVLRKAIPADIGLEYSRKVIAEARTKTQRHNAAPPEYLQWRASSTSFLERWERALMTPLPELNQAGDAPPRHAMICASETPGHQELSNRPIALASRRFDPSIFDVCIYFGGFLVTIIVLTGIAA